MVSPISSAGAEITTREEVHCLAFADSEDSLDALQNFLDASLPKIPNDEDVFGYQLAVNEAEEVIYEAPYLLISAIDKSVGGCGSICGFDRRNIHPCPYRQAAELYNLSIGICASRPAVRCFGDLGPL